MPPATRLIPPTVRRLLRRVFPHRPPDFSGLWDRACQKWVVGSSHVQGAYLIVTGWLVAPPGLRSHVEFRLNGRPLDRAQFPLPRPDVAARVPFVPDADQSGFVLWQKLAAPATDPGDVAITCHDARTGRPLGPDYLPYYVPGSARLGPVPGDGHIRRVIGEASAFSFALGGYTCFRRLGEAIGQELTAFPRVLDWGCGCARVSRYYLPLPGCQLTGVDVDPDNVGWCRANLPAGTWDVVPLRPPTRLPDAAFDLAFGVSVFTHLKEPDQFAWLAELQRVLRPGGLALMTFHGDASVVWSGLSAERYTALRRYGIGDQANPLYDADLGEADYYRDVFHTTEYVRREWGRYFEIVDIKQTWIAHQDLAVMRRR